MANKGKIKQIIGAVVDVQFAVANCRKFTMPSN